MRVVIAVDRIASLTSAEAGTALGQGWVAAMPQTHIAVVPIGESGEGFAQAVADMQGVEPAYRAGDGLSCEVAGEALAVVAAEPKPGHPARGIPYHESSHGLGQAVASVVGRCRPQRLLIDLGWLRTHDAGAGLLGALGAIADRPLDQGVSGLTGITELDLSPVHRLLDGTQLAAVVPSDQGDQHLLGLRGITSLRGREVDEDPARLLETDATLERFAALCNPEASALAGAGACGAAYAITALGGEVVTGPRACAELAGLAATMDAADLVVTGASVFDFGSRGGGVMQYVADLAGQHLRPCIAFAGEVVIGSREMRTMGIESAYPVHQTAVDHPGGLDVGAQELAELAARVAHTWSW